MERLAGWAVVHAADLEVRLAAATDDEPDAADVPDRRWAIFETAVTAVVADYTTGALPPDVAPCERAPDAATAAAYARHLAASAAGRLTGGQVVQAAGTAAHQLVKGAWLAAHGAAGGRWGRARTGTAPFADVAAAAATDRVGAVVLEAVSAGHA
eukprot:TRINITY_DN1973_c0_g1_i1.p3 TRINITY_DN1973_c0_g1~~TRINITY_DN1973_c0_g1_i1.p3  ORF type:complete len:155 (-),score=63.10 TRINITY_DN1973_c0_g1_i1:400-864(-)